ncbi:type II secretion system protein GspK [Pseudoalteromonas denitrificans]|uniref:Type II secretion system (T2SS), protein K n=1 Tax=Pseudoalteromonas denitrificans DSM 6059 TaxID=1123010 RepID=A0A1I1K330_9GAMM|nr:type II secretion system protein GspK [Pseudoalteromonas denitrificans]SFC52403.1 Type II secretion system (T2SS), protein K [Pseudoalteromonas denitrificans DSM 6059]
MSINKNINQMLQTGIALIQVLLIVGVLSVLALFLTYTAKEQVTMAQWADDKAQALINVHSTESELIFYLLTKNKHSLTNLKVSEGNNQSQWNFFAKPFEVGSNVIAQIQDQSALLHAQFPNRNRLIALIMTQNFSLSDANQIFDSLLDWQDIDTIPRINGLESSNNNVIRNGAVPDVHDFKNINKMTLELLNILINNTTLYRKSTFNPTNSSFELLRALTSNTIAKQVIDLRDNNQLSKNTFSELTGLYEDDRMIFYPSNFVSIKLNSKVGDSSVLKDITIEVTPYAKGANSPINLFSNRG